MMHGQKNIKLLQMFQVSKEDDHPIYVK